MPWHISSNIGSCSGYAVVKDDDGKVVGCHKTKSEAEAQLAALYASENKKYKNASSWNGAFLGENN